MIIGMYSMKRFFTLDFAAPICMSFCFELESCLRELADMLLQRCVRVFRAFEMFFWALWDLLLLLISLLLVACSPACRRIMYATISNEYLASSAWACALHDEFDPHSYVTSTPCIGQ